MTNDSASPAANDGPDSESAPRGPSAHGSTLPAGAAGPADDAAAPTRAADNDRLSYDGAAGAAMNIALSNSLLTLATLGVYRFWGKTRLRRYLWSRVSFLGDRVEYTGTGRELLLGFIAAIVVLGFLGGSLIGLEIALGIDHPLYWTAQGVNSVILLFLVFVAEYRARRYRLSRTEWRGIRFAQDGSSLRYALLALGWAAVTVLSLGLAYAVYRTRLQRYRTTHTSFGNRRFAFEGRAAGLLKTWFLAWLFLLPTFGLTYIWYRAREFRHFAAKSRCGALAFASDLETGAMYRIVVFFSVLTLVVLGVLLGALLLLMVTTISMNPELVRSLQQAGAWLPLGLGAADLVVYVVMIAVFLPVMAVLRMLFLIHPLFREVISSIRVIGEEDYAAIAQSAQSIPRQGEGLADALDVGAV